MKVMNRHLFILVTLKTDIKRDGNQEKLAEKLN